MSTVIHKTKENADTFEFSLENQAKVKAIFAKYPADRKQSAVMPLLDLGQRQNDGWVSVGVMNHVAKLVGMPYIRVLEVATFYTMYNLKPVGKNHVQVCTNISCYLRGSDKILEACKKELGVEVGETTSDGKFTLSEVECLGACANAPMIQINDDYYEDLITDNVSTIINELRNDKKPKVGSYGNRKGAEPHYCACANSPSLVPDDADKNDGVK